MHTTTSCYMAAAAMITAALAAVTPAAAYADCGDPGQSPCAGPVPTTEQVLAAMAELTDPGRPAAAKTDIVVPAFTPDKAETINDHLNRMNTAGLLPMNFVVTDIQPAPGDFAGATVATGGSHYRYNPPGPIVLVEQGGYWLVTHDTAMAAMDRFWYNAYNRHFVGVPWAIP